MGTGRTHLQGSLITPRVKKKEFEAPEYRKPAPFKAPTFQAPAWQTSRISALRQQVAAPQVGRLKRAMSPWMLGGRDPQGELGARRAIRGYGEGLSGIMAGAGQTALSQYGQEYATKFGAAKTQFGAELGGARADWEGGTAKSRADWEGVMAKAKADWLEEQRKRVYPRARGGKIQGGKRASRKQRRREDMEPPTMRLVGRKFGKPGSGTWVKTPMTAEQRRRYWWRQQSVKAWEGPRRAKGGSVNKDAPLYKVGERGPELVKYNNGRFELVGKRGPEIRTFQEEGEVIPAGKTKDILKRVIKRKRGGPVKKKSAISDFMSQRYQVSLSDPMYNMTKHLIGYPRWYVDTLMKRGWELGKVRAGKGQTVIGRR